MWQWAAQCISPKWCYTWATRLTPWCFTVSIILLILGTVGGLYLAPPDYQQGDAFRIIYLHVPTAILSLLIYAVIAICGIQFLIWHIKISDVVAKVSAPLGLLFTALALITGSLWGKPMWGTYWIWDARLTSELVLLFLYCGIIGLRQALPDRDKAAKASAWLAIVGVIDLPIIHYSVYWWNTLHQGQTLSLLHPEQAISLSMLWPLVVMIMGFLLYYVALTLVLLRAELLAREAGVAQ